MGSTHGQGVFESMACNVLDLHREGGISYSAGVGILALLVDSLRRETDWDTVDDIAPELLAEPMIHSALVVCGWYDND
jgi:hypothetical protein